MDLTMNVMDTTSDTIDFSSYFSNIYNQATFSGFTDSFKIRDISQTTSNCTQNPFFTVNFKQKVLNLQQGYFITDRSNCIYSTDGTVSQECTTSSSTYSLDSSPPLTVTKPVDIDRCFGDKAFLTSNSNFII
jgi:hypothetical protein